MSLSNEAGYLYVLSKDLIALNKKIKSHADDVRKHAENHTKATHQSDKQKHLERHSDARDTLGKLLEKRYEILKKMQRHQVAFAHRLREESKPL